MSENKEIHEYQAEMQKVLDILVHSLYTEREIFLRELISNASDALSKIQFTTLTNPNILDKDVPLEVKVSFNEEEKTISIEDSGIGMNKEDIIGNIGKIASSGTLKFIKSLDQKEKVDNLIGQFGVGFYSVFMVAKKVVLETRSFDLEGQGWEWSSEGTGKYELQPIEKTSRGTKITVYLKEDAEDFCAEYRLETIIKKYSDYVPFPVILKDKTVNQVKALWTLSKSETTKEDYEKFYKQLTHDYKAPFHYQHLSIDAPIQYFSLLFLPEEIGNEVLYARESTGISLYAQRIFIQNENKNLLPSYFRFVRGVVDSEDLPLNVSRENIQHNALLEKIKKSLVSRLLKEFQNISETDVEKYQQIWKKYGIFLKEGVSSDFPNRQKLLELLRFNSSTLDDADQVTSLKDVVSRMREEQKEIYYAIGPSREAILHNPNLEYFKENGLEVLYLYEHVDDFLMMDLREYDGKPLKSISQADIDIDDKKEDSKEALPKAESKTVIGYIKEQLGDKVADVVESKRLVGSPCTLMNAKDGMSSHMEKMMKAVNKDFEISKRTLEINTSHVMIKNMADLLKKDKNSPFLKDYVEQLFNNALLVEGLLDNPLELLPRMYRFMEDASKFHLDQP
ncbi:MAG: molecular chaperone HtpG [SAR324 cluster bacterium]|nr:molecular chaperone HtpG [SAR324 cluster bacterium]